MQEDIKYRNVDDDEDVPFAQIANCVLRDERISMEALGLLCRILSNKKGFNPKISYISHKGSDDWSKGKISRCFRELSKLGYAKLVKIYDYNKGSFGGSFYDVSSNIEKFTNWPSMIYVGEKTEVNENRGSVLTDSLIQIASYKNTSTIENTNEIDNTNIYPKNFEKEKETAIRIKDTSQKEKEPCVSERKRVVKEKKVFVPPTRDEFLLYCKENRMKDTKSNEAFDYYSRKDWKNRDDKQVKDWKATLRNVWFTASNIESISESNLHELPQGKERHVQSDGKYFYKLTREQRDEFLAKSPEEYKRYTDLEHVLTKIRDYYYHTDGTAIKSKY